MNAESDGPWRSSETGSALDELVDELTDRLQAGEAVDLEAFLRASPSMPSGSGDWSRPWR